MVCRRLFIRHNSPYSTAPQTHLTDLSKQEPAAAGERGGTAAPWDQQTPWASAAEEEPWKLSLLCYSPDCITVALRLWFLKPLKSTAPELKLLQFHSLIN